MGANSLFSNDADFSGMVSASSPKLKVSHVYHQSTFEVNEGGSEASAVSGIERCYNNNQEMFVITYINLYISV